MDSRKREGIAECVRSLETDLDELTADVPKDCVHKQDAYLMLDKVDSLLTAEPEPRGDARELLGAMFRTIRELGYREPPLTLRKETSEACVQLIESYTSRLAQESRADERAIVEREVTAKLADPVAVYANALRVTIDVSEVRDDERRRGADRVEAERITPENTDGALLGEGDAAYNRAIDHAKAAILQGTEPAKVREDVEMDAELVLDVLREYDNKSIAEIRRAIAALDRLVARIKEDR